MTLKCKPSTKELADKYISLLKKPGGVTIFYEEVMEISQAYLSQQKRLEKYDELFRTANRIGAEKDEPEGSRYIQISETLVNQLLDEVK